MYHYTCIPWYLRPAISFTTHPSVPRHSQKCYWNFNPTNVTQTNIFEPRWHPFLTLRTNIYPNVHPNPFSNPFSNPYPNVFVNLILSLPLPLPNLNRNPNTNTNPNPNPRQHQGHYLTPHYDDRHLSGPVLMNLSLAGTSRMVYSKGESELLQVLVA